MAGSHSLSFSFRISSPKSPFREAVFLFCFAVSPEAGFWFRETHCLIPYFSCPPDHTWAACGLRWWKTKARFSRGQSGDQIDVKTAAQLWGFRPENLPEVILSTVASGPQAPSQFRCCEDCQGFPSRWSQ